MPLFVAPFSITIWGKSTLLSTGDDVAYHYVASHIYMGELAFTLPDLNAKDSNGNYLWVVK